VRRAAAAAALVVLTLAVYAPVSEQEFLNLDDPIYVERNPNLRDGPTWESVARAFREPYETNWIPLTWLSLHVDFALWELEPAGYKWTNVALHVAATLLLLAFLLRATGRSGPATFVAAVFALHPTHVESVAWVSERKDTLSAVFFMLGLWAYAHYAERPGRAGWRWMLAVFVALALGLLAKPMLVTAPFVLLLLDVWPFRRLGLGGGGVPFEPRAWRRAVLEKLPLFAATAAVSVVTFRVQRDLGAMQHGDALPLGQRVLNALASLCAYLADAVWPAGLAVFYPHPQDALPLGPAVAGAGLLLGGTALALALRGRRPVVLVGWLWFVGMLVPVIGLVQVGMQARADRYLYLPLVGLSLPVAWLAAEAAARGPTARRALAGAGVAAVLALALTAHLQVRHWRDTRTLYAHAARVTRDNFLAHHGLGGELLRAGEVDAAEPHMREAVRISPKWGGAHFGLADVHLEQGHVERAIRGYERGLRVAPRDVLGHMKLADALARAGRTSEAIGRARFALTLAEDEHRTALVHSLLGSLHARKGDLASARAAFDRALALRPRHGPIHARLGAALAKAGETAEARAALERALALGVDTPEVRGALGDLALRRDDPRDAAAHYRAALAGERPDPQIANNLAWLLATSDDPRVRDPAGALRWARVAARAAPEDPTVLDTLAEAQAAAGDAAAAARTAERALVLAESGGHGELAAAIRRRLARYRGAPSAGP